MRQKQNAYYAALHSRNRQGVSVSDVVILVIIALVLIAIGLVVIWLLKKSEIKSAVASKSGIESTKEVTDRAKIPVNVAELPGGQYKSKKYIPVLTYHYIRELPGDDDPLGQKLSVAPETFTKQLAYLKSAGYESISFDDLREGKIPTKPIIITFDDGYEDAYQSAFPALQEYGFKGVFYIITGFVGKDLYLTWPQITEMSKNGMVFGSHTVNHPDLTSEKYTSTQIMGELEVSKASLERHLGITINDFCYPSGKATTTTVDDVNEAGYKTATSTQISIVQSGNYWLWLPRLRIKNDSSLSYILGQYGL